MQVNNVKNIVVLKNLPSNVVEEAIVILKSNKYVKKFQMIEKNNNKEMKQNETEGKDYIVKEAEAVISSYISKLENNKCIERPNKALNEKYKKLKKYSIIMTIFFAISFIINFA